MKPASSVSLLFVCFARLCKCKCGAYLSGKKLRFNVAQSITVLDQMEESDGKIELVLFQIEKLSTRHCWDFQNRSWGRWNEAEGALCVMQFWGKLTFQLEGLFMREEMRLEAKIPVALLWSWLGIAHQWTFRVNFKPKLYSNSFADESPFPLPSERNRRAQLMRYHCTNNNIKSPDFHQLVWHSQSSISSPRQVDPRQASP